MSIVIVEDRVLARVAFEAVAWNVDLPRAELADVAFGQAMIALRVRGIAVTPEIDRTVADDIALVLANPEALARARASRRRADVMRPSNADGTATLRASAG